MFQKRFPKKTFQGFAVVILIALFSLWIASQADKQVFASDGRGVPDPGHVATEVEVGARPVEQAVAPAHPVNDEAGETGESGNWFVVDEESVWSDEELLVVEQIMDRTWEALEGVGLDGEILLAGYHFRRLPAEFIPGDERLLAIVDHHTMEIILADGAFKRLHGFYIYHELGHAIDRQLERQPSEAYHRIAGNGQAETVREDDTWQTVTGFWLRYHGRDDREEATADAFAWWVMAQFDQPKPFFPGTPVTTDYGQIAQAIEEALVEEGNDGHQQDQAIAISGE